MTPPSRLAKARRDPEEAEGVSHAALSFEQRLVRLADLPALVLSKEPLVAPMTREIEHLLRGDVVAHDSRRVIVAPMETIDLLYAAPIPSGHRVQIRWYNEPEHEYGFMTDDIVGHHEMTHEPVVEDLDTHVLYGPMKLFLEEDDEFVRGDVNALSSAPSEEYKPGRVLEGRVLSARVLIATVGEWHQIQTTLTIEPEVQGGSYR